MSNMSIYELEYNRGILGKETRVGRVLDEGEVVNLWENPDLVAGVQGLQGIIEGDVVRIRSYGENTGFVTMPVREVEGLAINRDPFTKNKLVFISE